MQGQKHQTRHESEPQPNTRQTSRRPAKEPCKDKNTRLAANSSHRRSSGKQTVVRRRNHARPGHQTRHEWQAQPNKRQQSRAVNGLCKAKGTRLATNPSHRTTQSSQTGPRTDYARPRTPDSNGRHSQTKGYRTPTRAGIGPRSSEQRSATFHVEHRLSPASKEPRWLCSHSGSRFCF